MAQKKHIRDSATALFTRFPKNGRVPFKQVVSATWISTAALLVGIGFVLAVAFSADGKPIEENVWYQYTPTFIAVGAVILRGSLAALLGIALYQNLWVNIAAPGAEKGESLLGSKKEGGISLKKVDSLHLASRLAVGMFGNPVLKGGWIIGVLGLAITSAVQPVLQSAISVQQERHILPSDVSIYHPQFNGSLAQSEGAMMSIGGATTIPRRSSIVALMGTNSGLRYTDVNVTGEAHFGPVNYLDVSCDIEAIPGKESNAAGWDVYNFTYRYPDAEKVSNDPTDDLTQFRNVSDSSVLYDGVDISTTTRSKIEVRAVMFNNTHYLSHLCTVQTAIGSCATHINAGTGTMGALKCVRDRFVNMDSDLEGAFSFYGPAGGVRALISSFLEVFVGKALLDVHNKLNFGRSLFMLGTMVVDTNSKRVMPSDLLSHMQRVLWVTPLLAKTGAPDIAELNVTMSVADERNLIVYKVDKIRVVATVAVLFLIGFVCLGYLTLTRSGACGRLMRDSLVHSLTVAGPNGPAVRGACLASLEDVLDKAGDETIRYGTLVNATDSLSGHLGFADETPSPKIYSGSSSTGVGKPVPGMWYGGYGHIQNRKEDACFKQP